ncbi:MAG: NAD(P)-dependent oxidoreductase [Candidatus Poribacteria bacterium]|nr:NAD(P)-dependent oxidoreductase [Candidatus Poribacteria bacterium]
MLTNTNRPRLGRCLVIGARGFIGQNVHRALQRRGIAADIAVRETPMESLTDGAFDAVFFCAGNSKTYLSRREPITCLQESVIDLHAYLTNLRYDIWFHLSSSTVYPQGLERKSETSPIAIHDLSIYAAHKLLSERYVTEFAKGSWVIVRPTSFFGTGLKKGLIFDVWSGQKDVWVTTDSRMDVLPIDTFGDMAISLTEQADNTIINVGSGVCVPVKEILAFRETDYQIHAERRIDDGGLVLDRLRERFTLHATESSLREAIRAFVRSPFPG